MYVQHRRTKTPKRLMRDLLEMKGTSRPLFVPLVYRYASKVSQIPLEEMLGDPNHLSRSLIMAQELFGYDGIISSYDLHLEMEALGLSHLIGADTEETRMAMRDRVAAGKLGEIISKPVRPLLDKGRIRVIRESAAQISQIVGPEIPVIAVLNGPATLLNRILYGDFANLWREHREQLTEPLNDLRALVLEMIKSYCEQRVDAIWLAEEDWARIDAGDAEWVRSFYKTFWNVTQYYDVKSILCLHSHSTDDLEKYFSLGADAVFFAGPNARDLQIPSIAQLVDRYGVCAGIPCPYPENQEQAQRLDSTVCQVADFGRGFFFSTACEVPLDVPVEWLHHIVDRIKGEN